MTYINFSGRDMIRYRAKTKDKRQKTKDKEFRRTLRRCAAEILDDFIPTCRQHGDIYVGLREMKNSSSKFC